MDRLILGPVDDLGGPGPHAESLRGRFPVAQPAASAGRNLRALLLLLPPSLVRPEALRGNLYTQGHRFFGGWVFFLWPIVLMLALRFFWHKRLAPPFS